MKQCLISLIFCFIFQITNTQAQPMGISNFQEALEACNILDDSSITSPAQIKVIFVVDKGSHNYTSNTGFDVYGNDRFALTRTYHVRQFFDRHRTNECFSWSMITFSGGGWRGNATASISNNTGFPIFTKDYDVVDQAINNLSYVPDDSPDTIRIQYGNALELIRDTIGDDLGDKLGDELGEDLRPDRPDYYFVFIITGASPSHRHFTRYSLYEYTYKEVESIANIKPGMIFVSTAYYGKNHLAKHTNADGSENLTIPNIITILQTMADAGRGRFFNLERGQTLDLNLIMM